MNPSKTFGAFLAKLLALESGISPMLFEWYVKNFNVPVIPYAKVSRPGRCVRDFSTGQMLQLTMTVQEYFQALGVSELFNKGDSGCIEAMQYQSMNALGFVGYQFGEAALQALGYYETARSDSLYSPLPLGLEVIYRGEVAQTTWQQGCTHVLINTQEPAVIGTDVNEWRGRFTGKGYIHSLKDLFDGRKQEIVIHDLLSFNYDVLFDQLDGKFVFPDSITLSGALAAAHLSGPYGAARFLRDGRAASDEFGTPIQNYLIEFSGYSVPFESV